jgi:homoserine dehydrogenase
VARAWNEAGRTRAVVRPEEIPLSDPLSTASGTGAALRIETDCMNPIIIMQEHPSVLDTAYGVLNDLLTISGQLAP